MFFGLLQVFRVEFGSQHITSNGTLYPHGLKSMGVNCSNSVNHDWVQLLSYSKYSPMKVKTTVWNILNDKNYQASTQKFRKCGLYVSMKRRYRVHFQDWIQSFYSVQHTEIKTWTNRERTGFWIYHKCNGHAPINQLFIVSLHIACPINTKL